MELQPSGVVKGVTNMILTNDIEVSNETIERDISRLTNLIFKLLPCREEGGEWKPPLQNLILEIGGMKDLISEDELNFFVLLCKMQALMKLDGENDFLTFRRLIFECLNILTGMKKCLH